MLVPAVSPPHPRVHRITVDERLDDDRVRLLITSLAPKPEPRPPYQDGECFHDRFETWMPDEREVCITQSEFTCLRTELGISSSKITWKGMHEGCVYLAGEFSIGADCFSIARGQDQFEPINDLEFVKMPVRELFTSLLAAHDTSGSATHATGRSVTHGAGLPVASVASHDTSLSLAQAGGEP
jgi:hypothetical protein